jgi:UDP-N-acetylglucosamine--N-acetylmuramyl-(pentapeptide) pyrophosphoryl-undecaprenol N-acetylglucosamine transferase
VAPLIGYYAHHHGSGHRVRAELIAAEYPGEVAILGSHPGATVPLPADDDDVGRPDRTAHGALHWAPRHHQRLPARSMALLEWVRDRRPALVVVDVSVEVAVQARLVGVPVVVVRQHGLRVDDAHALAYRVADGLIAPYPKWAEDPSAPAEWRSRTFYAGGFSRFTRCPRHPGGRRAEEVAVVIGRGGTAMRPSDIVAISESTHHRWDVFGATGQNTDRVVFHGEGDPWPALCRAGAAVVSAGHSALCEAAVAGVPTIAVVEERPFDEQRRKVDVLARHGAVRPAPPWSEPEAWARLLADIRVDPPCWKDFVCRDGARSAAHHLADLACRLSAESS